MNPGNELLAGRYRLLAPIGAGHPAKTFVAIDEQSGSEVVIKRLALHDAEGWKQVELAEREAQVLQRLDHQLLPRYLDHFEQGGALFTVMTRLAGEDLRAARRRGVRFTVREALLLLDDASSIFEYLHGLLPPIIHRDIKPSNVLICPDQRFRLVDFGSVAQALRADGTTVVGTFGYMAPEQFQGRAGPGSDIYGLAATILTTLTGVEPERQPHRGLTIDVLGALGGSVDERFCHVLQGMLQPNPDERPSRLRHWLAQTPLARARASHQRQLAAATHGPRENPLFIYTCAGIGGVFVTILSLPWLGPSGGWLLPISVVVTVVVSSLRRSR